MSKVLLYSPSGHLISSIKSNNRGLWDLFNFDGFLTIEIRSYIDEHHNEPFAKRIRLISYRYDYEDEYPKPRVDRKITFG